MVVYIHRRYLIIPTKEKINNTSKQNPRKQCRNKKRSRNREKSSSHSELFFLFRTLLDSHQINISQINDNDLEQCDVVQNNLQKEFVSNTMDYIGNETLADYFNKSLIETKNNPSKNENIYNQTHQYTSIFTGKCAFIKQKRNNTQRH